MDWIKATIFMETNFTIETMQEHESNFEVKDTTNILKDSLFMKHRLIHFSIFYSSICENKSTPEGLLLSVVQVLTEKLSFTHIL